MGLIGGYDLHLYCDVQENCTSLDMPHKFGGRTKNAAKSNARSAGWTISENGEESDDACGSGRTVCPACSNK